ncbi:YciI family protein [Dietzia lutea]|uniref:YCII-related domain-containing protein n=1 Tax=Dietzia lutea TaxID=546160 RepID=A0A2S1R732_9ACTN|nr:YciI family protein [Dietzia lutea]AWH92099.1 hypothetical protein A6035_07870 [Dietzia lutea]
MKYVLLLFGNLDDARCGEPATDDAEQGPGPEAFIAFDAELDKAGVLAGGFALEDPETGVSVACPPGGGEPVVTSGPLPESREFVGGTIVIDVADIDEALAWAARCPGVHGGRVEIRAIAEF